MIDVTVENGEKVADMLAALGKAATKEFKASAKRATREHLKPVLSDARAAAPVDSGRLKKAIKLRVWKRPQKGEVGHKVFIDPGYSRDDPRGAFYGRFLESGVVRNGRYYPGRYFLTSAYVRHADQAAQKVADALLATASQIIDHGVPGGRRRPSRARKPRA